MAEVGQNTSSSLEPGQAIKFESLLGRETDRLNNRWTDKDFHRFS